MSKPAEEVQKVLDFFKGSQGETKYYVYNEQTEDEYLLEESLSEALEACGLAPHEYFIDKVDCFENPGVTIKAVTCSWIWDGVVTGILVRTMQL